MKNEIIEAKKYLARMKKELKSLNHKIDTKKIKESVETTDLINNYLGVIDSTKNYLFKIKEFKKKKVL